MSSILQFSTLIIPHAFVISPPTETAFQSQNEGTEWDHQPYLFFYFSVRNFVYGALARMTSEIIKYLYLCVMSSD